MKANNVYLFLIPYLIAVFLFGCNDSVNDVSAGQNEIPTNRPLFVNNFVFAKISAIQHTNDKGVLVAGNLTSANAWIVKFAIDGKILWQKSYGLTHIDDMSVSSDGSIVAIGNTPTSLMLLKLTKDGVVSWSRGFTNTAIRETSNVRFASDGSIFVIGDASFPETIQDPLVIKFNSTGTLVWSYTYGSGGADPEYRFTGEPTPNGGVVIGGQRYSLATGGYDPWVLFLDADGNIVANGDRVYNKDQSGIFSAIYVYANGDYILAGNGKVNGSWNAILLKFSSDGVVLWQRSLSRSDSTDSLDIDVLTNGKILATGYIYDSTSKTQHPLLSLLDINGSIIWQRTFSVGVSNNIISLDEGSFLASGPSSQLGSWFMVNTYNDDAFINPDSGAKFESVKTQSADIDLNFEDGLSVRADLNLTTSFDTVTQAATLLTIENLGGLSGQLQVPNITSVVPMFNFTTQLQLNWVDNNNEEIGYIIFRSLDGTNYVRNVTVPADSISYVDNVEAGTTYYYKIRAFNRSGYSDLSLAGLGTSNTM